jgi:glycosyltransferase involved in cell wall biosynthesis
VDRRPCLVSTVDAGREVVNPPEAGLDADPDDVEAIGAAVCRLLSEGLEWDRWSANARQRYERYYTGRAFQDRLMQAITARVPA